MVLFEIPIPFLANKVVHKIYELNPNFQQNQVDLSIRSVAIGWNYSINRPVILLKGISYSSSDYSINLSKVGFYPSISNSLRDRKLYLQKVFVEGLNFIVGNEDGHYKVALGDKNLLVNQENNQENPVAARESFFENLQTREDFKKGNYYQLIDNLKSESEILRYLNEFIIYKSSVVFISQLQRVLILDVDNLSLRRDNKQIFINLASQLTFDNDIDKFSNLSFSGSIGSNNIIVWNASLENILLANIHKYILRDNFLKDLSIDGFNGTLNLSGLFDTSQGLQEFNALASVKDGLLTYKNYISNPLRVNSISSQIAYNKNNNTLEVNDFNVIFANNNIFSSDKLGLNILLNRIDANLQYNLKDGSISANNINLFSGSNKLLVNFDYLPDAMFKLNAETSNIDVDFVKLAWPKNYLSSIRKWIVANVKAGRVDNSSFALKLSFKGDDVKIDALSGDVFLSNARTIYLKGLPEASAKNVVVKYNVDDVSITYNDGITGKIISSDGEIKFFSRPVARNSHEHFLSLNLKADSTVENALLFINNQPLNLIAAAGLIPSKFTGNAVGEVKLKYSFMNDSVFDKEINLHITDASMEDALPDVNVSGGDLNFLLNDSGLKINGIINALEEQLSLGVQVNWENHDNIIQTYSVNVNNFPIEKLNRLSFIDKKVLALVEGSMDGNFTYMKSDVGDKLTFYNDLSNASFFFDFFNYRNKVGNKLIVEGVSIFDNNRLVNIKDLKLTADDLNVNMNLNFNDKGDLSRIIFSNFYIKNIAAFKGTIDFTNDLKSFDLKGSLLNIAPVLEYARGGNTTDDASAKQDPTISADTDALPPSMDLENMNIDNNTFNESIGNIQLRLAFDKIVNNNETLNNAYLNLLWEDNFIKLLNFSARINTSRENSYMVFDDKTSILGFRISNLGSFLRLFNFSSNIRNGDFAGKVNIQKIISQQDKNKFYIASDGSFTLNNFVIGIGFSSAFGEFRGRDLFFQIDKLELQGNLMGGNMQGYIDIKNGNLDMAGQLIPLWSVNNIISNLPLLRPLFENTPIPTVGQITSINTRVRGPFNNIRYSLFTRNTQGDTLSRMDITNNESNTEAQSEETNPPQNVQPYDENPSDAADAAPQNDDSPKSSVEVQDSPSSQSNAAP
ncbi:MAG: hypothetical protein FWE18_00735 [Alphaproteobacteria bacterium]|nr:hypothetical protein [Alphaproteobacteria bacterium]